MSGERKQWRYLPARRIETLEAEIVRLRAEVERLRAEREDIDLLHVPCTDDDLTFCHECVGGWPCRTHLRLHPEEARRG